MEEIKQFIEIMNQRKDFLANTGCYSSYKELCLYEVLSIMTSPEYKALKALVDKPQENNSIEYCAGYLIQEIIEAQRAENKRMTAITYAINNTPKPAILEENQEAKKQTLLEYAKIKDAIKSLTTDDIIPLISGYLEQTTK